jgi:pimeloyl-ACP methyl ester carboxylesterase
LENSRRPNLIEVAVEGLTLGVWDWPGSDPPLVFAHATSFHGRCWDQVIRCFPDRRCIAPDARGHGRSSKPAPPYHWKPFGADLSAIAELLNLKGAVGIGHSMGGHSITAAAVLRPATFSRLLLVDPTIRPSQAYGTEPLDASFIRRRRQRWSGPEEMFENFRPRRPFDRWQPQVLRDYCEYGLLASGGEYVLACPPEAEASVYECSKEAEANLDSAISSFSLPVTVLRAGLVIRQLFPTDHRATDPHLAARFPQGRDVLLKELTHLIPMEAPEVVAGHIAKL